MCHIVEGDFHTSGVHMGLLVIPPKTAAHEKNRLYLYLWRCYRWFPMGLRSHGQPRSQAANGRRYNTQRKES
jgi:hypothetical protein